MRLIIDTNRYSDLTEPIGEVVKIVSEADEVAVPFVVLAELNYGFRKGSRRALNEKRLNEFLSQPTFKALFPDSMTVDLFADLRIQLHR